MRWHSSWMHAILFLAFIAVFRREYVLTGIIEEDTNEDGSTVLLMAELRDTVETVEDLRIPDDDEYKALREAYKADKEIYVTVLTVRGIRKVLPKFTIKVRGSAWSCSLLRLLATFASPTPRRSRNRPNYRPCLSSPPRGSWRLVINLCECPQGANSSSCEHPKSRTSNLHAKVCEIMAHGLPY